MIVDEPQLHKEPVSFPEAEETMEVVPEPFLEELLGCEVHEVEEALMGDGHEEEMHKTIPVVGEGFEV